MKKLLLMVFCMASFMSCNWKGENATGSYIPDPPPEQILISTMTIRVDSTMEDMWSDSLNVENGKYELRWSGIIEVQHQIPYDSTKAEWDSTWTTWFFDGLYFYGEINEGGNSTWDYQHYNWKVNGIEISPLRIEPPGYNEEHTYTMTDIIIHDNSFSVWTSMFWRFQPDFRNNNLLVDGEITLNLYKFLN